MNAGDGTQILLKLPNFVKIPCGGNCYAVAAGSRSNMTKFLAAQATVESVAEIKSSMKNQMLAGKKSEELENKSDKQDENNLAAFELQSQQFRKAQEDFDDYMDRLKDRCE